MARHWFRRVFRRCYQHIGQKPTEVSVKVEGEQITISSDASLLIRNQDDGRVVPFEVLSVENAPGFLVNALSQSLTVRSIDGEQTLVLAFERGERVAISSKPTDRPPAASLRFTPDKDVLEYTWSTRFLFDHYLNRLSSLYPQTQFTLEFEGVETRFGGLGLRGLFEQASAPFQLLHEPVHVENGSTIAVEVMFAFHTSYKTTLISFVNDTRSPLTGVHERGFWTACDHFCDWLGVDRPHSRGSHGVAAVMFIRSHDVKFEAATRNSVTGPPALEEFVATSLFDDFKAWAEERPVEHEQLKHVLPFRES
ncbi:MAG: hypothetical protein QF805_09150 [Pirellulaceae bacterium]|nr:hypothetical protein [Pirellulaceae bacterium]